MITPPKTAAGRAIRIAVIGAGAIGLACALELRRRGAEVVVYDHNTGLGGGATMRAAGMLGAAYEGAQEAESPALYALMQASAEAWPGFAREVERLGGGGVEYAQAGTLACAVDAADDARLSALAKACQARGVEARLLSRDEARALEPTLGEAVTAALLLPGDRQVDAQKLLMRLGRALGRIGVGVRLGRPVERIGVGEGVFVAPDGDRFDRVLVATGAGAQPVFAGQRGARVETGLPEMIPVKGQMLALAAPEAGPRHVIRGRDVYIAPKERWVLAGSTTERGRADAEVERAVIDGLRTRAARLVPALAGADELAAWAGVRPATADGLPVIGETALSGVFAAMGHYRNGVLLAPATAALAAGMMLEGDAPPQAKAFTPLRFDNRVAAPHSP